MACGVFICRWFHEKYTNLSIWLPIRIGNTWFYVHRQWNTRESCVFKCTTCEAWSAFGWHHTGVFHCQWNVPAFSDMLIQNAQSILICVIKYVLILCSLYHVGLWNLMKQSTSYSSCEFFMNTIYWSCATIFWGSANYTILVPAAEPKFLLWLCISSQMDTIKP